MRTDNFEKRAIDHAASRQTLADIVIVGGGVIGLSIARELAWRGVRDIVLLEKGELGKESSWAAAGILGPQAEANRADEFFKLSYASRDMYPQFAERLRAETGIDVELDQTGTLYLAFTDQEEAELRRRFDWQHRDGLRVEWLTSDEARRLEPEVSPQVRCALRFPDDWQVENRQLLRALITANEKLGVRLIANCEATSLRVEHGSVRGVETLQGSISARSIVLAAGAWSSHIGAPEAALTSLEINPVRGQMICFKTEQPIARHVIYSSRGYLVPRRDCRILAGSTSECVGFDKRVTGDGAESIQSMALAMVPRLESVRIVESWAGLRPHAPDDLPVLGEDANVDGLFYATGHYRNGILLAPITAHVIADLILRQVFPTHVEAFSPNRFCAAHT